MEAYVNAVIEEHYHTLPLSVKALGGGVYGRGWQCCLKLRFGW